VNALERLIINILLRFFSADQVNTYFADPRNTAILVGSLVAVAAAVLGVLLLLRKMTLVSDAISHSVLFGIVVAFLVMIAFGAEPELSSPWLIVGAALAGILTVTLTEALARTKRVNVETALGLVFPLLFALAVIMVGRYIPNVHLDADAVMIGEIGVAWANTNSHCLTACDSVTITAEDPRASVGRRCVNCTPGGITPRDPRAEFETTCANCGTYSAAEAWRLRLIDTSPTLVFFPRAVMPIGMAALANCLFVLILYKELKLATFDSALAAALGFRPGTLTLTLMGLVSLTAVTAFNAVGAVLVVAFFILPAAATYLLTDRLWRMVVFAPLFGIVGVVLGYEAARALNLSISASMVVAQFALFLVVWFVSPRYGLIAERLRREARRRGIKARLAARAAASGESVG